MLAIRANHFVETTYVGMDISTVADDFGDMFLHVAPQACPLRGAPAKGWEIFEILALSGQIGKFLVIVDVAFGSVAEEQPITFVLMPRGIGKQPLQHRSKWSDSGARRDEEGIAWRRMEDEVPERPLTGEFRALLQIA